MQQINRRTSSSLLVDDDMNDMQINSESVINNSQQLPFGHSSHDPRSTLGTSSTPSELSLPYWRSKDSKELLICILFGVICFVVAATTSKYTTERPIPSQLLNTGEYVRNLTFNESFDGETIPDSLLILLAIVIPWILQIILGVWCGDKGDKHATFCVFIVALSLTQLTTDLIKMYCGYLRPIFYTICEPDDNYETCKGDKGGGESYRRSFPSGHASTSFCGLTLMTLFIHTRFGVPCLKRKIALLNASQPQTLQSNNHMDPMIYRGISVAALIPMGVACFIAASRVVDNKHFPADVTAGSILGAAIANFVHGLWFS